MDERHALPKVCQYRVNKKQIKSKDHDNKRKKACLLTMMVNVDYLIEN